VARLRLRPHHPGGFPLPPRSRLFATTAGPMAEAIALRR
jgi:hypothetical protein